MHETSHHEEVKWRKITRSWVKGQRIIIYKLSQRFKKASLQYMSAAAVVPGPVSTALLPPQKKISRKKLMMARKLPLLERQVVLSVGQNLWSTGDAEWALWVYSYKITVPTHTHTNGPRFFYCPPTFQRRKAKPRPLIMRVGLQIDKLRDKVSEWTDKASY